MTNLLYTVVIYNAMISGKIDPHILTPSIGPIMLISNFNRCINSNIIRNIFVSYCNNPPNIDNCINCKYLRKDDRCSIARVIFKLYCQSLKIDVND